MTSFRKLITAKPPAAKPGEVNYPLIDRFTLVHFMIGVGYAILGLNFWGTLFLSVAWELIENPLKFHFPFIFPHGTADSLQNSVGDSVFVIIGWIISVSFLPPLL